MTKIGGSDLDVFPLNLGGNTFGWTADTSQSETVLDAFVAGGGNFIDTADGYSAWVPGNTGGDSERIIGDWLVSRKNRSSVVIATKVSQHPDYKGLAASNIAAAADASLGRLRSDYIDLYYAHFDDEQVPIGEIAAAFDALVKAGKVRAIGISNFSPERIRAWMSAAEKNGLALPVALQPHYNLVARQPYESTLAPLAAEFGLGVMPYFSLASGFLTGKYRIQADLEGKARGRGAGQYLNDRGLEVIAQLESIATERGVSIATTALAWLLAKPGIVAPIASATTVEQLKDLMAVATVKLSPTDVELLDNVSATR